MTFKMIFTIAFLLFIQNAIATIYYVKQVSSGNGNGLSWANASGSLQLILTSSAAGDQIWVAAGTYKPSQYPSNCPSCSTTRDYTFHMVGGVKMFGGFAGTEASISQRNINQNPTILSGDIGLAEPTDDNVYHILVYTSTTSGSELNGFKIIYGGTKTYIENSQTMIDGKNLPKISGGGLFISGDNLSVKNCVFALNTAYGGSGINLSTSNEIIIDNCRLENNTATNGFGGGLSSITGRVTISNSTFSNNSASQGGGAAINPGEIYPKIFNCIFTQNSSFSQGGALFYYGASNTESSIINSTIVGNSSYSGGGIFYRDGNSINIRNTIIWINTSSDGGGTGIHYDVFPASINVANSIIQEGFGPCTNCPPGNGNVDPQFTKPALPKGYDGISGTFDDGLSLRYTSPAINTGDNTVTSATDILGRTKVGIKDIGAIEFIPKNNCIDNRHVGDNPIENGSHYSTHKFTSDGTIGTGSTVYFNSGDSIELLPGFKTLNSAVFRAIINDCVSAL